MMRLAGLVLWIGLVVSGGCSSFSRDYAAIDQAQAAGNITGAWAGEWKSNGGHQGALRCILTQTATPAAPNAAGPQKVTYDAQFEAKFWGLFTAHYSTPLAGTIDHGTAHLTGDHELTGLGGGHYHYEADVTPGKFDATYRSEVDQGVFRMTRPAK